MSLTSNSTRSFFSILKKTAHPLVVFKKLSVKKITLIFTAFIFVSLLGILAPYKYTSHMSQEFLYNHIDSIPYQKVGLVLGTSKYRPDNTANLFYKNRIQAAVDLYHAGKISHILVSGDNAHRSYNEPKTILQDLLKAGIEREHITLDFAGFRTLDSVVRAYKIFGQKSFTIISQEFHNQRAVYLARTHQIQAIGFNATTPKGFAKFKVKLREHFARILMFWDLLSDTQPKFLGPQENI